jgi:hypothetical protein
MDSIWHWTWSWLWMLVPYSIVTVGGVWACCIRAGGYEYTYRLELIPYFIPGVNFVIVMAEAVQGAYFAYIYPHRNNHH